MRTKRELESVYERYIINRAAANGMNRVQLAAALGITTGTMKTRLACRKPWLPVECNRLAHALKLTDIELLYLTVYRVPLDDEFAAKAINERKAIDFAKRFWERFPEYAADVASDMDAEAAAAAQ